MLDYTTLFSPKWRFWNFVNLDVEDLVPYWKLSSSNVKILFMHQPVHASPIFLLPPHKMYVGIYFWFLWIFTSDSSNSKCHFSPIVISHNLRWQSSTWLWESSWEHLHWDHQQSSMFLPLTVDRSVRKMDEKHLEENSSNSRMVGGKWKKERLVLGFRDNEKLAWISNVTFC